MLELYLRLKWHYSTSSCDDVIRGRDREVSRSLCVVVWQDKTLVQLYNAHCFYRIRSRWIQLPNLFQTVKWIHLMEPLLASTWRQLILSYFKIITGWSIAKIFRGCHIFASNQIRTRDCWVRSTNTTSVLPKYNSLSVSVFSGSGGGEVVRA